MDSIPFLNNVRHWPHQLGPESDVVLSSRIRLARNLKNAPFPGQARPADLKPVLDAVSDAARAQPSYKEGTVFSLGELSRIDRELLVECHLISRNHADVGPYRGLVADADGNKPLMINEEDHVRLAVVKPGFQLQEAWEEAEALDRGLGRTLSWATHSSWGFLTACPTNCGTGLRASARLHLPALGLLGRLPEAMEELGRLHLSVRGFYGEGTRALGDIFQISNGRTLGPVEGDIIGQVKKVLLGLIRHERVARKQLLSSRHRAQTEDHIYRAMAILHQARRMSFEETLTLLSRVRMGLSLDLKLPVTLPLLNEIMELAQPVHVQKLSGRECHPDLRDSFRADLIRKALASHR
jgi:protein arginine kinase